MSVRGTRLKLLGVLAVVALATMAVAPPLSASTATGSQQRGLTVTASLRSNGANPEVATTGNKVFAFESVRNTTSKSVQVDVTNVLTFPSGDEYRRTDRITLRGGKTYSLGYELTISQYYPRGVYTLTASATKVGSSAAPSTATAQMEVR